MTVQGFPSLFHKIYEVCTFFQAKPRPTLSCLRLPRNTQRCAPLQLKSRLGHHMASALFPEIEIRYPEHQAASGTNNLKARAAAANIAPTAKNAWGLSRRLLATSAEVLRALIIKDQPLEALFIATI